MLPEGYLWGDAFLSPLDQSVRVLSYCVRIQREEVPTLYASRPTPSQVARSQCAPFYDDLRSRSRLYKINCFHSKTSHTLSGETFADRILAKFTKVYLKILNCVIWKSLQDYKTKKVYFSLNFNTLINKKNMAWNLSTKARVFEFL